MWHRQLVCASGAAVNARGIVFALHVRPVPFHPNGDPSRRGSSRRLPWLAQFDRRPRADHHHLHRHAALRPPARVRLHEGRDAGHRRFRADAILFERAYSHCPLTLVSHATFSPACFPPTTAFATTSASTSNPKATTLAELLKSKGYATGGAVSAFVLRGETGIKRGFDFWDDSIDLDPSFLSIGRAQRSGDETRALAQKWIGEHDTMRSRSSSSSTSTSRTRRTSRRSRFARATRVAYDGEIATADAIVGNFLDYLREEGIYDRATIVLLSDHGEGLGDHGEEEHGILLYREALQVPLMLKLPEARAEGNERRGAGAAHRRLPDDRLRIRTGAEVSPANRCSMSTQSRPRTSDLRRDVLSAASLRLERSALAHRRREALHPGADAGALRPRHRSRRDEELLREDRRTYVALREQIKPYIKSAATPSAGRRRAEAAAHRPRLRRIDRQHRARRRAARSQGEHRQGERDQPGVPPFPRQQVRGDACRHRAVCFARTRTCSTSGRCTRARSRNSIASKRRSPPRNKVLRVSPNTASLAVTVANLSLELGRLDDAEAHAKLVLKQTPHDAHRSAGRASRCAARISRRRAQEANAASTTTRIVPAT